MIKDLVRVCFVSAVGLTLALNVVACDEGDDSMDGDGGGDSDTAGDGGDGADGGGDTCGDGGGGGDPNADCEEYTACIQDKCGAEYDECYGPNYFEGKFEGHCADWLNCAKDCPCDDMQCPTDCFAMASQECIACSASTGLCAGNMCMAELTACGGG